MPDEDPVLGAYLIAPWLIINTGAWKVFLHMTAHIVDVWGTKQTVFFELEFNPRGERWGSYKGPDEEEPIVTIGAPYKE